MVSRRGFTLLCKLDHVGKFGDLVKNADADSTPFWEDLRFCVLASSRVVLMAHPPPGQ